MTTQDQVRKFIAEELKVSISHKDLTDDYPLLEKDVLDSMGIFQVVSFLEDEYGVEIDDRDLVSDNFETIDNIARLVDSKSSA